MARKFFKTKKAAEAYGESVGYTTGDKGVSVDPYGRGTPSNMKFSVFTKDPKVQSQSSAFPAPAAQPSAPPPPPQPTAPPPQPGNPQAATFHATQAGQADPINVIGQSAPTAISSGPAATRSTGGGRPGEFIGLKTQMPDQLIPISATPRAQNWNGVEEPGALSVRRGLLKMADSNVTFNGGAVSTFNGISILHIPPTNENGIGSLLMLWYNDPSTGDVNFGNTASAVHGSVKTGPGWSRPKDISGTDGMTIVVADGGSGDLDVTVAYTDAKKGNSIAELVIRRSTVDFPVDINGLDETSSVIHDAMDYDAWDGSSELHTDSGLTLTTWYVTAWAVGYEGVAKPARGSVVLA